MPEPGSPTNTTMRICDHHIVPRNWDQYYADSEHVDLAADPLLIQAAELLPPGHALDLACGPGRHALYLGLLGWQVTAVDSSATAIGLLRMQSAGLAIDSRLADLERGQFTLPPDTYDLVCDFHYLHRDLFPRMRDSVHPGGVFVAAIHLAGEDVNLSPHNPVFLLQPGELRAFFDGWEVLFYSEGGGSAATRKSAKIIARRA